MMIAADHHAESAKSVAEGLNDGEPATA